MPGLVSGILGNSTCTLSERGWTLSGSRINVGVEVKLTELIRHEFLGIAFDVSAVETRLGVAEPLATHSTNRSFEEFRAQIRREERREIKLHHSAK